MEQSAIDKLMELKRLYEAGILTKEELEAEKQKVLENETAKETPQSVIVVQETVSSPSTPTKKSGNKGLWLIGTGALAAIIIIICVIVSHSQKAEPVHSYDLAIDSLTDDYTDDYVYEEEVVEEIYEDDDLYEIDDWVGTFVITGCIYRTGESRAILTLKKTDRKSYYIGTLYLMQGSDEGMGQFDYYGGTMNANVKAKLQDNKMVVVLDDFTIGSGEHEDFFSSFKQGQQIFCITNSYGAYSVKALEEMEFFFDNYTCDNEIYKQ